MTLSAYLEQFSGDTKEDIYDLNSHQDLRVYEVLKVAGVTDLSGFSWTCIPIPFRPNTIEVHLATLAPHDWVKTLLKYINSGVDFRFNHRERPDWIKANLYFGSFTMTFSDDGKNWRLEI